MKSDDAKKGKKGLTGLYARGLGQACGEGSAARAIDSVAHEHGNGHGAHAAGHGGDEAGHLLAALVVDVPHELVACPRG